MNRIAKTAVVTLLAGLPIAASVGTASAAPAEVSCPDSGAACFYASTGFNDIITVLPASVGSGNVPRPASVRNRTPYTLCFVNPDTGASTSQAPSTEGPDLTGGGWNQVTAHVYFVDPGASC
ncbi:hypothetical protein [Amycolatopsis samaneae]|uniref:Peptidase inhibitor family I36 n=1 Tax=Amycolatopsis samaneae TaxID=664691 RepID=A0ABW5GI30_9PSEU